jgi:hypothetical protein
MIELKTTSILADEAGIIWFTTDIKAPLYWWYAFEHKVIKNLGNSCFGLSSEPIMKTIEEREFKKTDFSYGYLGLTAMSNLENTIKDLNSQRWLYLKLQNPEYKKKYWHAMMQSLPQNYMSCGKFRYSLGRAFIMLRALKPKLLGNEYEFKEFTDFFEYLEKLVDGFSL